MWTWATNFCKVRKDTWRTSCYHNVLYGLQEEMSKFTIIKMLWRIRALVLYDPIMSFFHWMQKFCHFSDLAWRLFIIKHSFRWILFKNKPVSAFLYLTVWFLSYSFLAYKRTLYKRWNWHVEGQTNYLQYREKDARCWYCIWEWLEILY